MSSVFISNIDDYIAPSQACVNPLFSTSKTNDPENVAKTEAKDESANLDGTSVVKIRERRRRPNGVVPPIQAGIKDVKKVVQASIADCLACSGCITTAETVLLEQTHSLDKLQLPYKAMVITVSPASMADLQRHYNLDKAQIATLLQRTFVSSTAALTPVYVLDGNVPLAWSLELAAQEFCQRYQERNHQRDMLLSSSCPAVVCLVEKKLQPYVPSLSKPKSPMALAQARVTMLLGDTASAQSTSTDLLHVAIMPCHDKKLEATRPDTRIDLVLTTNECVQYLLQIQESPSINGRVPAVDWNNLESLPSARVATTLPSTWEELVTTNTLATLVVPPSSQKTTDHGDSASVEYLGSGGYADSIFRFAAHHLFGYDVPNNSTLVWKTVSSSNSKRSARVARRQVYQALLYRVKSEDGSLLYATTPSSPEDEIVLKFGIANGYQTLQEVLQQQTAKGDSTDAPYDYLEAMACPMGCVNGGGQIRGEMGNDKRETPSQTRQRVEQIRSQFTTPPQRFQSTPIPAKECMAEYHTVAPMQHSMGAAKGVAVQDMQW